MPDIYHQQKSKGQQGLLVTYRHLGGPDVLNSHHPEALESLYTLNLYKGFRVWGFRGLGV